jgi:CDP-diglyceride synthetase
VCIWVGGWLLALGAAVLATMAFTEFWQLGRAVGVNERLRWEVLAAGYAVLAAATVGTGAFSAALGWGVVAVIVGGVIRGSAQRDAGQVRGQLLASVWAILALLYIPWLLGHLLLLRHTPPGRLGLERAMATLVLVWLGDVAAFAIGATLGRHRLAAVLSPGKSVEGLALAFCDCPCRRRCWSERRSGPRAWSATSGSPSSSAVPP